MHIKLFTEANRLVIKSVRLTAIEEVARFKPDQLVLRDENGEDLFAVAVSRDASSGKLNRWGAEFSAVCDEDGCAKIVLEADDPDVLYEKYGAALTHLAALEAQISDAAAQVRDDRRAFANAVQVI